MKKSIFILIMTLFMIGSLETGCKKSEKEVKENEIDEATHEAQQDARIKMEEDQTKIDQAEWDNFKKEIDAKMNANEIRINDLRTEVKKSSKYDNTYISNLDTLEKQNIDLRGQMNTYDKNQKDWNEFKKRFNKDIDAVGKKLDELKAGKKK